MSKNKMVISITAIASLALLETVALLKGIDGALFMPCLIIIAGIAGYTANAFKGGNSK